MSSFDESKVNRLSAGTSTGGQFANKDHPANDRVGLMGEAESFEDFASRYGLTVSVDPDDSRLLTASGRGAPVKILRTDLMNEDHTKDALAASYGLRLPEMAAERGFDTDVMREARGLRGRMGVDQGEAYVSASDESRRDYLASRGVVPERLEAVDREMLEVWAEEGVLREGYSGRAARIQMGVPLSIKGSSYVARMGNYQPLAQYLTNKHNTPDATSPRAGDMILIAQRHNVPFDAQFTAYENGDLYAAVIAMHCPSREKAMEIVSEIETPVLQVEKVGDEYVIEPSYDFPLRSR